MASSISPDKAIAAPAHSPDGNACLQFLPPESLGHIAEYLPLSDRGRFRATSHAFYHEVSVSQYDSACNLALSMNKAVPSVNHRALVDLDPLSPPRSEAQFNAFKIKQGLRSMYKLHKLLPTDGPYVKAYQLKHELSLMHFTSALPDNCLGDLLDRINSRRPDTPLTLGALKIELRQQTPLYITEIRQWFDDPTSSIKAATELNLSWKSLKSIPYEIGKLTNLQVLNLTDNKLRELPDTIGNLKNLQLLNLNGNQFIELPHTIGSLKNLQELYLAGNKLRKLPHTIGNLKNLRTLSLDRNELKTLPYIIGSLKNLQALFLAGNKLRKLPHTIGNLKNLQTLFLYNNQLIDLPDTIGSLKNLQILFLYNNQFIEPPHIIGSLVNLRRLCLSGNRFTRLPRAITRNLVNLVHVDLPNSRSYCTIS